MVHLEDVYKGKKIFLTGHTGFKGAWLLKILHMLGAHVKGYALATESENNLYSLIGGDTLCESIIHDIRSKDRLLSEIKSFAPDFIFHLAAQPLVRLSYEIPAETFEVNVIGTANVLDGVAALKHPCSVVLITTDKVYFNNEWHYPYRENDRLGGYDPYSASKACAELVIESYKNSFFNANTYDKHQKGIAVGRAGNVIGGGDWAKFRLLPDIARSLGNNEKIIVRNPSSIRPWQHVLEPLLGYLMLGAKLSGDAIGFSQAYNFGPYADDALQVEKMVQIAIEKWGAGEYETPQLVNQLHEAGLLKLDISKVISEIGWRPKFNAAQAVAYTIDWYKEFFYNKRNIEKFTEDQITNFINA